MTEDVEAWLAVHHVPRGTAANLAHFAAMVAAEAQVQNLVADPSPEQIWSRHILDSLQLLPHANSPARWLDIGTGAGFPGMIVAIASDHDVTLTEPRGLRARFLAHACNELGLGARASVQATKIEGMVPSLPYGVISARAVASLDRLFSAALPHADGSTIWLLPKGRSAAEELAAARRTWQGEFELVPSITDPAAAIVIARRVRPRSRR